MKPDMNAEALAKRLDDPHHMMQRDGLDALLRTGDEAAAALRALTSRVEELKDIIKDRNDEIAYLRSEILELKPA